MSKEQVRTAVASCQVCQSIDLVPAKWHKGSLSEEGMWQRIGMDITHYRGKSNLTLIDCRLSRFAVWRALRLQTSENIVE